LRLSIGFLLPLLLKQAWQQGGIASLKLGDP
jgi:hypothetical protein